MSAWLRRVMQGAWRALLSFIDDVRPGWSQPAKPSVNEFGPPLSEESLNYWLHAYRVRRYRD